MRKWLYLTFIDNFRWLLGIISGWYWSMVGEDVFPENEGATERVRPLRLLMPPEGAPELRQAALAAQKFLADPLSCLTRPPVIEDEAPEFANTWKTLGFNALLTEPETGWRPWAWTGVSYTTA